MEENLDEVRIEEDQMEPEEQKSILEETNINIE
jgi:hypothetical protein